MRAFVENVSTKVIFLLMLFTSTLVFSSETQEGCPIVETEEVTTEDYFWSAATVFAIQFPAIFQGLTDTFAAPIPFQKKFKLSSLTILAAIVGDSVNLGLMWVLPKETSSWLRNAVSIVVGTWLGGWLSEKLLGHLKMKRDKHIAHASSYRHLEHPDSHVIEMQAIAE